MVDSKKKLLTIIPEEVEKFSAIATEWWDKNGKFKPLHKINPVRVVFIRDLACKYLKDLDSKSRQPLKNIKIPYLRI